MGDWCGGFSADTQKRNIGRGKVLETISSGPFTIHKQPLQGKIVLFS